MELGLVIKVLQCTGINSSDADASDTYCVLSTGSCRYTTRCLPAKRSSCQNPWPESFLLSPRDLKHATTRMLPPSPNAAGTSADAGPHDAGISHSSPVLTVELYSTKRWGSDAVTASGELLLAPLLQKLQPSGPPIQAKVALQRASSKSGARSAKSVVGSPGIDSGWVLGAESQCMILELVALAAPQVPVQLLGPVGSGRAEVAPIHSCSASWLSPHRTMLHTSGGHIYQTPSVQLLKLTLHGAQGLDNLHVDPVAAAAAAAAISRLAATGESPSKSRSATERARLAAANAVLDGSKVGKSLLNKTSTWFGRKQPSTLAAAGAAVLAASSISQSSKAPAASNPWAATAQGPAAAGGSTDGGMEQAPASSNGAAAGSNVQRAPSPAAAGAYENGGPSRSSSPMHPLPRSPKGAPAGEGAAAAAAAPEALQRTGSSSSQRLSAAAAAAAGGGAAEDEQDTDSVFDDDHVGIYGSSPPPAAASGSPSSTAAATATATAAAIEDPVTRLKQALQHTRTTSVDAEAVMAALEENGFHATDAPGGAFVYAKLGIDGECQLSRVVGLGPEGQAVWDQSFWLAVTRPAPAGAVFEVELFASKDDKSRGKPVATVKVPLQQLLHQAAQQQQQQQQANGTGASRSSDGDEAAAGGWFRTRHVLQASFSDHLHCTLSLTLEAADWDTRAQQAGVPRALLTDAAACEPGAAAAAAAVASSNSQPTKGAVEPAAPAGSADAGVQQQQPEANGSISRADSSLSTSSDGRKGSDAAPAAASSASSGSSQAGKLASRDAQPSPAVVAKSAAAVAAAAAAAAGAQRSVGTLDVAVKAFDTRKPLDVFFVLLVGPYCLVSSTSHSTHHHSWGWHLQLPLTEPADMLSLALFAREDQAGGKKKVGASMLTMFSSSIRMVGKLRVRLSTLTPNTPLNISLPLQGERTNLRPGHPSAAVAHLYFHLHVPQLLGGYLASYFRFAACSPALYLLASSSSGEGSSLEVLASEAQQTTARWLEQQPPSLPARVFRRVQDDGRFEFSLSRTRANWRRLILLREATAPAREAFRHLCSWENTLHSGGWYCVILLFGLYPSKVLSVLLLICCVTLARARPSAKPALPSSSTVAYPNPSPASAAVAAPTAAAAAQAIAAAAGPAAAAASIGVDGPGWRLFSPRPPPVMYEPGLNSPEEALLGSAVPADPYTALKQNYEGVVQFLTTVQNVLDGWAAAGERLQLAFSWSDQLATAVLLVLGLLLSLGLWLLGLKVLVTMGLLWLFRHPILRDPLPPPPVNFVARMPTRSDTML